MRPTSARCTDFVRLTIGRDPLSRLLSAFRNKLSENGHNESLFRQKYLPTFSLNSKEHPVTRLVRAVLEVNDDDIDGHFMSQERQCFRMPDGSPNRRPFNYVAHLNSADDADLDVLSARMRAPRLWRQVIRTIDVVNGAESAAAEPMCWEGCGRYLDLIERLRTRFTPDIILLRSHGLPDFNQSFTVLRDDCEHLDRACNGLHDVGPWASLVETSGTAGAVPLPSRRVIQAQTAAAEPNNVLRPPSLLP